MYDTLQETGVLLKFKNKKRSYENHQQIID